MRHLLILPDGSELYSGSNEKSAIASVKLTRCVNPDKELTPGGVCAAMLEVTVLDPGGVFSLEAGQEVTLFSVDEAENRTQVGIFIPEAPRRQSAGVYHLTAYDRVSLLDVDLGQWLAGLLPGKKVKRLFLQSFVDRDTVLFSGLSAPDPTLVEHYRNILLPFAEEVTIRN